MKVHPLQLLCLVPSFCHAAAFPPTKHALKPRDGSVVWSICPDFNQTATQSIECASLTVPLDYFDPTNNATLDLEIRRVPATKTPKLGSILVNYGGPGIDGRDTLPALGDWQQALAGGVYDIVLVVPRGTGNTLPYSCLTPAQRLAAFSRSPVTSNASDTAFGRIWASAQLDADACLATQNKTGTLVGTVSTANDFIRVAEALDKDGLLRFWGQSYGTYLGTTLAKLFPDRVERMVLDGVVDPVSYTFGSDAAQYLDADFVFREFCSACAANPSTCPLALGPNNSTLTGPEIEVNLYAFFDSVKEFPIPLITSAVGPLLLDIGLLKSSIYFFLYSPSEWPAYSTILAALIAGNTVPATALVSALSTSTLALAESVQGIRCSDKTFRATSSPTSVEPGLAERQNISYFGDNDQNYVTCARWPFVAKGRYEDEESSAFRTRTRTRGGVLLVGNRGDPATALRSAKGVRGLFGGSRVLEQKGFGHTAFAQGSRCTAGVWRSYFVNGTLPKKGAQCEVDVGIWEGKTGWEEIVAEFRKENGGG
ncbi:hypothetical protein CAC42_4136 [Sphaceloma murrayae]|uniref:Uncharacterized protein n=1 Tax=Sphaceloma murrayae TaxID=2082308 RepID=A0A2K1QKK0_9PEZI|nr:hypothetical protein CAC42_4136 [Sphaceloma murrayae]